MHLGIVQVVNEVLGDDLIVAKIQAHADGSQKPSAFCFPRKSMSAERPDHAQTMSPGRSLQFTSFVEISGLTVSRSSRPR